MCPAGARNRRKATVTLRKITATSLTTNDDPIVLLFLRGSWFNPRKINWTTTKLFWKGHINKWVISNIWGKRQANRYPFQLEIEGINPVAEMMNEMKLKIYHWNYLSKYIYHVYLVGKQDSLRVGKHHYTTM